ncbi:MAG: hypothetical protein JWN98_1687 [Abditibacteriota bacterium]|nr:hypothetical protein [Abditibacteriota bacterium]
MKRVTQWNQLFVLAGFVMLSLAASRAVAAPVSMAVQIVGAPQFKSSTGSWKTLRLLQKLSPGASVKCPDGSKATLVMFSNGERFEVAGGQATVGEKSIVGARSLGALGGPSARVAKTLSGSRTGAISARPAQTSQRLRNPDFKGWFAAEQRQFLLKEVPAAASYSFTLFDRRDNVVWATRTALPQVEYPGDAPALRTGFPYVWRAVAYAANGNPKESQWGVMTFLTVADAQALQGDVVELEKQLVVQPGPGQPEQLQAAADAANVVLLAGLYQNYGVMNRTLELLELLREKSVPGAQDSLMLAYKEISPYAQMLSPYAVQLASMPAPDPEDEM